MSVFEATIAPYIRDRGYNWEIHFDETPVDLQDDLDRNPGIGSSKGLFAETSGDDADLIERRPRGATLIA